MIESYSTWQKPERWCKTVKTHVLGCYHVTPIETVTFFRTNQSSKNHFSWQQPMLTTAFFCVPKQFEVSSPSNHGKTSSFGYMGDYYIVLQTCLIFFNWTIKQCLKTRMFNFYDIYFLTDYVIVAIYAFNFFYNRIFVATKSMLKTSNKSCWCVSR